MQCKKAKCKIILYCNFSFVNYVCHEEKLEGNTNHNRICKQMVLEWRNSSCFFFYTIASAKVANACK